MRIRPTAVPAQKSWRTLLLFITGAGVALIGAAQPISSERSGWVARTEQWTISWNEFSGRYKSFLAATGSRDNPTLRETVLDNLVNEMLLLRNDSESLGSWRQIHGEDVDRVRDQALLAYVKDQEVFARITVSEKEAREAFSRSHEQIAARHLYARTESEAQELLSLVRSGVSFETLARQTFTDSTLRNSGGFLGYFSWGDMDPAFEDAAFQLQVGQISDPVATATGYSIIRVEGRLPHPLLTENQFLQRRAHVERVVRIRKRRPAERAYLESVLPSTSITFHPEALRTVAFSLQRPSSEADQGKSSSGPCVTLPERVVSCDEVIRSLSRLPAEQRMRITSDETLRSAIRGILLQERLLKIAHTKGYDTVDVVREAMDRSEHAMFFRLRVQQIVMDAEVKDEDLRSYYEEHLSSFKTENEMQVRELIVGRKELADSLKGLIDRGADFAELAGRFSLRRSSGGQGGMLPTAPVSRYGALSDLLWNAPIGSLLGPIPIGEALGLFLVFSRHEGHVRSFTEVKDHVRRLVQFEHQRTILSSHFDGIKRRVPVTIDRSRLMTTALNGVSPL